MTSQNLPEDNTTANAGNTPPSEPPTGGTPPDSPATPDPPPSSPTPASPSSEPVQSSLPKDAAPRESIFSKTGAISTAIATIVAILTYIWTVNHNNSSTTNNTTYNDNRQNIDQSKRSDKPDTKTTSPGPNPTIASQQPAKIIKTNAIGIFVSGNIGGAWAQQLAGTVLDLLTRQGYKATILNAQPAKGIEANNIAADLSMQDLEEIGTAKQPGEKDYILSLTLKFQDGASLQTCDQRVYQIQTYSAAPDTRQRVLDQAMGDLTRKLKDKVDLPICATSPKQ